MRHHTERVDHLLACLGEECGEVQQVVGKALRFGLGDSSPKDPTNTINRDLIKQEVMDVVTTYLMLMDELGFPCAGNPLFKGSKFDKVKLYIDQLEGKP